MLEMSNKCVIEHRKSKCITIQLSTIRFLQKQSRMCFIECFHECKSLLNLYKLSNNKQLDTHASDDSSGPDTRHDRRCSVRKKNTSSHMQDATQFGTLERKYRKLSIYNIRLVESTPDVHSCNRCLWMITQVLTMNNFCFLLLSQVSIYFLFDTVFKGKKM